MSALISTDVANLASVLDREIGPSQWLTVDQDRINAFAELSGDHQWIHVDPARAARESPYGTTIAHGNLTLSLLDGFRGQLFAVTGAALAVNYGWDRVRFPAPVKVDSRIRATLRLTELEDVGGGWWHTVSRFTVEVEGASKPCCVADSVIRYLAA
jgi:acyl dehydratase